MSSLSEEQSRTTAMILDEYCRYYSDFSKILGVYVRNFHPHVHFEVEQLLDASYNVWHRLSDEEKISLATFLEEMSRENQQQPTKTYNNLINSKFLKYPDPSSWKQSKSIAFNTSSSPPSTAKTNGTFAKKPTRITPFHIYLKDERPKLHRKHAKMSMREINRRLSERWQRMSQRMKEKYQQRSYLAKKRLYKKQGRTIALRKPSFIKRRLSKPM